MNLSKEFKHNLFNKSLNFVKINSFSKKLLGKDVFYYQNNNDTVQALSQNFDSSTKLKYYDGEKFIVSNNLPIGAIKSGVVISIGNQDKYGNTVIIQGVDGFNIWYGNLKDVNLSLYDYVEEGNLIGSVDKDYIYLVIEKNNRFYTYEEYTRNKD